MTSTTGGVSLARGLVAAAFALSTTSVGSLPIVLAQTSVAAPPKVEVATIHRNKDVEGARASAPPGTLIREGNAYVQRSASDVTRPGRPRTDA